MFVQNDKDRLLLYLTRFLRRLLRILRYPFLYSRLTQFGDEEQISDSFGVCRVCGSYGDEARGMIFEILAFS